MMRFLLLLTSFTFITSITFAQRDSLRIKINKIILDSKADIGVGILHLEKRDSMLFNDRGHYPMQSVFKFPLAIAVLHEVDSGGLTLDQKINVKKEDLMKNTWSPMRDKYPNGGEIPLRDILSYTVSQSDNNGCDVLFKLLGGPEKVNTYIHSLGVKGIQISATEKEMHESADVQFSNWCEPSAMLQLLDIVFKGSALSKSSNDFLRMIMAEANTGPKRLKGLLPEGTIVEHKTGTGTNDNNLISASNDVGIVTLPNGEHYAIVVYVSNFSGTYEDAEKIIAEINKSVWDYYIQK